MNKITPTVDQIAQDHITQLAQQHWLNKNENEFNQTLVNDIYLNELLNNK
jgi:hypothetical protein